jgi:hypothetical protein
MRIRPENQPENQPDARTALAPAPAEAPASGCSLKLGGSLVLIARLIDDDRQGLRKTGLPK